MDKIIDLVNGLYDKNDKSAYRCLKELELASKADERVYPYFDYFAKMLAHPNSYIRTRGLLLISANAQWDKEHKIDEIIDEYLRHITDDKPITSRQCVKALPNIAKHKPALVDRIRAALEKADLEGYPGSMQSLISNDIIAALKKI